MNYISMFSGIEAASVAFAPLGWNAICFAEIEAFPSAVLASHYPDTPNVGDMTRHDWAQYRGRCDAVVGGPPCQAFSVAGLRRSLDDDRGNLSLYYMRAVHAIDPLWCITENVPGWLSTKDNAFGCFLAGMVGEDAELLPPGGRWTDAGVASGPERTAAWRCLDAQYFGLAQRRKRVFVLSVRGSGNWRCAEALFPLTESVPRNPPPRREAGKGIAPTIAARTKGGGGLGTDFDCDGGLIPEISMCLNAGGMGRQDSESETLIAHALRAEGLDASEDGTGRGTPIVAQPVAFSAKDHGADAGEIAPTLRADGFTKSHANGGVMPAVAIPILEPGKRTGKSTTDPRAGMGVGENGDPMFTLQRGAQHGVMVGSNHAGALETDTYSALRALRETLGEKAFAEWGLGVLDSLQSPEVLRSEVHGGSVRCEADEARRGMGDGPLSRSQRGSAGALREVRQAGRERRTPHRRELSEQLARELEAALSQLSSEGAQATALLHDLRRASEGIGVLQQALHPIQGRPPSSVVRRLTPRECERLMGFPEIVKSAIILVCSSAQIKTAVLAEIQNPKSQTYASLAVANELLRDAGNAESLSHISLLGRERPVALNVHIDLEREAVRLHSRGRLLWSASNAVDPNWSRLPTQPENFVLLSALLTRAWEAETQGGRAASPASINSSSPLLRGSVYALASGPENEAVAKDVLAAMMRPNAFTKSTTSEVGPSSQACDLNPATWPFCATAVTSGFIPSETLSADLFAITLSTARGYTFVPYRGKPAADGPRYKALGNSMAVPVMAWIGKRIQMAEAA